MSRFTPQSSFSFILQDRHFASLGAVLVALGLLALALLGGVRATARAAPADCSSGNVPSIIESDTTLPQDLYVTENVTIRSDAVVTLTAGTQVTMCGPYQWWVQDARLLALGTEAEPVVFSAQNEATPWERIYVGGGGISVQPSHFRHVILQDGGGSDPTAESGALHIYSPGLSVGAGPVLDHVTVRNSGSYGIYIRMDEQDPDPLSLTNLTVSGSARAPLMLYVSAMRGLGDGHSLTANTEDVIEVRAGTVGGGIVYFDQRWLAHDVPYHIVSDFGGITLRGDNNPKLTIDPGVTLLMGAGADVQVQTGGLVA
ncbi:MAG: hypothetical protein R3272_16325, partial [Candidatus Promineifilaceae bacterium]|nr:hypothetical protein [Candidatus Promineifilaceae bacterium]